MGSLGAMAFFMNSGRRSEVASVQYGGGTMTANPTTFTISAVDLTRSAVLYLGTNYDTGSASGSAAPVVRLTLTNATTVTADTVNVDVAQTVRFCVVTFATGAVKSIQSGTVTVPNGVGSATTTITSVNTAKAILFWGGVSTGGGAQPPSERANITLTNATTVTATHVATSASQAVVAFTVVEFN